MDSTGKPRRLTATGDVPPHANGGVCWGGVLTPAAAASTVVLRENGSGGTVIMALAAPANGPSVQIPGPFEFAGTLHATLSGASAEVTLLI